MRPSCSRSAIRAASWSRCTSRRRGSTLFTGALGELIRRPVGGIDAIIRHLSPADLDYVNTRIATRLSAPYAEHRAADRQLRA